MPQKILADTLMKIFNLFHSKTLKEKLNIAEAELVELTHRYHYENSYTAPTYTEIVRQEAEVMKLKKLLETNDIGKEEA